MEFNRPEGTRNDGAYVLIVPKGRRSIFIVSLRSDAPVQRSLTVLIALRAIVCFANADERCSSLRLTMQPSRRRVARPHGAAAPCRGAYPRARTDRQQSPVEKNENGHSLP